jgi:amino acid adenylation domain-containing protein
MDDHAVPDLPLDRPRSERRASTTGSVGLAVDSGVVSRLVLIGQECDAPLRAVLLAVYVLLLRSYGGDHRVVVESAPATSAETVRHTLALVIADDMTARDAVISVRDGLRAAAPDGQAVRPDLPVFSWLAEGEEALSGDGPGALLEMRGELWLHLVGEPEAVAGVLRYAADVLDGASARRMADRYLLLAGEIAADPDRPVSTLPLMTSGERALFETLNSTAAEPLGAAFHEVFEAQAERTPAEVAAHSFSGSLTYRELDRRANQLAWLLHGLGVQVGDTVGICMDNGLETVVAVLGVLKAGGAYVPVDPADPRGRQTTILQDAGVRMVLATPQSRDGLEAEHPVVELDHRWTALAGQPEHNRPPVADAPTRAAYILYTSGTTGRPKGVVVENRQLMSYVSAVVQRLDMRGASRSAMVQPLTVDSCVTALVPPLCTGGTVHPIPRNTGLDADRLADWFQRWPIDCLKIAPSHLRALQASPRFADLLPRRLLIVGGEASPWKWLADLQRLAPGCRVVNHYGPTETTVGVLTFDIAEHPASAEEITPIGFPLPNTQAYIVDGDGQECPIGVAGELVIGGDTVARGYHGADQRAAAAFVSDPLTGDRRYRTGDIARRLADGAIMFLGRRDDQIKVRGRRVQIGEIDAVLARHPAIRQAVTVVHAAGAGERVLIAYVEPRAGAVTTVQEIRAYLAERLPVYMVPQTFTLLDSLPLSPHGKVDRSALPRPEPNGSAVADAEFHGETEQVVAAIWRDLLGLDTLGPDQNFFDVGGHSLLLVDLQHRLVNAAGKKVDLLDLLHHPSVRAQASMLSDAPRREAVVPSYGRSRVAGALQRRREQQLRAKRGRHD